MKIEKTECSYQVTECDLKFGERITLDGEVLIPVSLLDKVRAEILEEKECAYADFERYKVEYLGQDWDDVYDNLPQDDFRYGMERCIDIIDKYKAEEDKE